MEIECRRILADQFIKEVKEIRKNELQELLTEHELLVTDFSNPEFESTRSSISSFLNQNQILKPCEKTTLELELFSTKQKLESRERKKMVTKLLADFGYNENFEYTPCVLEYLKNGKIKKSCLRKKVCHLSGGLVLKFDLDDFNIALEYNPPSKICKPKLEMLIYHNIIHYVSEKTLHQFIQNSIVQYYHNPMNGCSLTLSHIISSRIKNFSGQKISFKNLQDIIKFSVEEYDMCILHLR